MMRHFGLVLLPLGYLCGCTLDIPQGLWLQDAARQEGVRKDAPGDRTNGDAVADRPAGDQKLTDRSSVDKSLVDQKPVDKSQLVDQKPLDKSPLVDKKPVDKSAVADTRPPDTRRPDGAKPDSVKPDSAKPDTAKSDGKPPTTCSPAVGLELCVSFSSVQGTTVNDESGNGRNATLRGAAQVVAAGKTGPSVLMTGGATDSVDFGQVLGSFPKLTVTAWFKFTSSAKGWDAVVSRWSVFKGYWLGGTQVPGGFEWWIDNIVVQSGNVATSGWTHLAGTFDQSAKQMKVYVNGVLKATKAVNGTITPPTFPLELGHGGTDFTPMTGNIDEVRIWSTVRTQPEICTDAGGTPALGGGCTL